MLEILILVCAYGAYRIVSEIIDQRRCPEEDDLYRAVTGRIKKNSATYSSIIRHLGVCESCQKRAKEIGAE